MIKRKTQTIIEQRENMRGGVGSVTLEHFFKPEELTAKSRLCAKLTLPPGAGIGLHQHEKEDEIYIILKGTGLLTDGSVETEVTAGDSILTGNGASHSIKNIGAGPLEMIAVIILY